MRLFATQRPRGFRHRDRRTGDRPFDFHRAPRRGKSLGATLSLAFLLILLLALWKIIN